MRIATWNVLHRIHAVNWHEPVIDAHPDEDARIAAIVARVATLADIVCLQEVSGDLVQALSAAFRDRIVEWHRYPRVPRLFRSGVLPVREPAEYLVTIARLPMRHAGGGTFATDPGKGYLVVAADDLAVINTHVSYGERHAAQCAELAEVARTYPRVAIVGDFNAERDVCLAALDGFVAADPVAPALPTRPRTTPSTKAQTIDHVLVHGCMLREVEVVSGDGLSDHNPVVATVRHLSQNTRRDTLKSP